MLLYIENPHFIKLSYVTIGKVVVFIITKTLIDLNPTLKLYTAFLIYMQSIIWASKVSISFPLFFPNFTLYFETIQKRRISSTMPDSLKPSGYVQ
jgi:hypothetical protein